MLTHQQTRWRRYRRPSEFASFRGCGGLCGLAGFKNIVIEGSSVLELGDFLRLSHQVNPLRSRLMGLPLVGTALARIFYLIHWLVRGPLGCVFVAEKGFPVIGILGYKASRES